MFCAVNNPHCGKKKKTIKATSVISAVKERNNNDRRLVKSRKTSAGTQLSLIRYLKLYQKDGIDYIVINNYFKQELKDASGMDSTSKLFILDMLTYDTRMGDPTKDYDEVITNITNASTMINWGSLYEIVRGLKYD